MQRGGGTLTNEEEKQKLLAELESYEPDGYEFVMGEDATFPTLKLVSTEKNYYSFLEMVDQFTGFIKAFSILMPISESSSGETEVSEELLMDLYNRYPLIMLLMITWMSDGPTIDVDKNTVIDGIVVLPKTLFVSEEPTALADEDVYAEAIENLGLKGSGRIVVTDFGGMLASYSNSGIDLSDNSVSLAMMMMSRSTVEGIYTTSGKNVTDSVVTGVMPFSSTPYTGEGYFKVLKPATETDAKDIEHSGWLDEWVHMWDKNTHTLTLPDGFTCLTHIFVLPADTEIVVEGEATIWADMVLPIMSDEGMMMSLDESGDEEETVPFTITGGGTLNLNSEFTIGNDITIEEGTTVNHNGNLMHLGTLDVQGDLNLDTTNAKTYEQLMNLDPDEDEPIIQLFSSIKASIMTIYMPAVFSGPIGYDGMLRVGINGALNIKGKELAYSSFVIGSNSSEHGESYIDNTNIDTIAKECFDLSEATIVDAVPGYVKMDLGEYINDKETAEDFEESISIYSVSFFPKGVEHTAKNRVSELTILGNNRVEDSNPLPRRMYTLNVSAGEGGSITPDGDNMIIAFGATRNITVTPDEGYELEGLYINGKKVTEELKYRLVGYSSMPYINVEAVFAAVETEEESAESETVPADEAAAG